MSTVNRRRNFDGNVADDDGGSYYVVREDAQDDRLWAGPFGSAPYAIEVKNRCERTHGALFDVEYQPGGPVGVDP